MTNPVTPVPISPLPDAPLITDTPAVFNDKAFPFSQALDPFGDQINATAIATNTNAVAAKEGATASAASASASAASAVNAAGSVTAAAAQVTLAVDAKDSAWNAAAAAGAAAGLPALEGNANKTLSVRSDEQGVEWGDGGLLLGDVKTTASSPNADWIETNNIYLQSSYPDLFGVLGLRPNAVTATTDAGLSIGTRTGVAASSLGTVIAVGGSAPLIRRRSAAGVWSSPSHSAPSDTRFGGVGSGNGVFVAVAGDHGWTASTLALRSADDGVTWSARVLPSGGWYIVKCEEQSGYWMAIGSSQCAVSRDAGLTWVAATLPSGVSNTGSLNLAPCGAGRFLLSERGNLLSNVWVATVTSSAVTWAPMALPASIYWLGADLRNGVLLVAGHSSGKLWLCRSTNFGTSFSIEQQDIPNYTWLGIQCTDDIAVISDNSGRTLTSLSGGPFQLKEIPSLAGGVTRAASLGKDCVLVGASSASTSMARISGKDYDAATQFYVPQPNVTIAPFKNWVKAK